jgi:hypothetical protein
MTRPTDDTATARMDTHIHLRQAFSLINKSLKDEIYIATYVTAFSIVEDRVYAMYVVAKRIETDTIDIQREPRRGLVDYVEYLKEKQTIPATTASKICNEAGRRNKLLHGAMWNLKDFNKKNTERVVDLAKELNQLRADQRKKHGVGYKVD